MAELVGKIREDSISDFNLNYRALSREQLKLVFGALKKNESVTSLLLSGNHIDDDSAISLSEVLEAHPNLKTLEVSLRSTDKKGHRAFASALAANTTLELLFLVAESNAFIHWGLDDALRVNKSVKGLFLKWSRLGDDAVGAICQALKSNDTLTSLDLRNTGISSRALPSIIDLVEKKKKTLKDLNIGSNAFGSECGPLLASLIMTLEKLNLRSCRLHEIHPFSPLLESVALSATLTHLNLESCGLDAEMIPDLFGAIARNNCATLKVLSVEDNRITSSSCTIICRALMKSSQKITHLNLSKNYICFQGAGDLSTMLKSSKTLLHLDVSENDLEGPGAELLADALRINQSLEFLNIERNKIGQWGAEAVANVLPQNATLKVLLMGGNCLLFDATRAIETGLRANGSIVSCVGLGDVVNRLCERNQRMHARVKESVLFVLLVRKRISSIPREVYRMVAQALWRTKADVTSWLI